MSNKKKKLYKYLKERNYLELERYLSASTNNKASRQERRARVERQTLVKAIKRFQIFSALPATGRANRLTFQEIEQPRCGFPNRTLAEILSMSASPARWGTLNITYAFRNFLPQLGATIIREAKSSAFDIWKESVPEFIFREVGNTENHLIEILFTRGSHNDSYPFFGPDGDLAHAFLPDSPELPGDIHFDTDDMWSVDDPSTHKDFITVAAHEIGHSLGLEHSSNEDALMFGPYRGLRRELHAEDRQRIRSLYT